MLRYTQHDLMDDFNSNNPNKHLHALKVPGS